MDTDKVPGVWQLIRMMMMRMVIDIMHTNKSMSGELSHGLPFAIVHVLSSHLFAIFSIFIHIIIHHYHH